MNSLVNLLLKQNSYPVGLAKAIGLEHAIIISEMLKRCDFGYIDNTIIVSICRDAGVISLILDKIGYLERIGLLEKDASGKNTRVSIKWFEEFQSDEIEVDLKESEVFRDPEFKRLFANWRTIIKKKGFKFDVKEHLSKFEGRELKQCLEALTYSINNQFKTLYFNEDKRGNRGGGGSTLNKNSKDSRGSYANSRYGSNGAAGGADESSRVGSGEAKSSIRKGLQDLGDEEI